MRMENLKAKSFDLRKDTVDIIVAGKGGLIGGDISVIDTLISLYFCQMNVSPERLDDPDRDRFVLSKGHSVEAYYAVLAARGFLDLDDIKALRDMGLYGAITGKAMVYGTLDLKQALECCRED